MLELTAKQIGDLMQAYRGDLLRFLALRVRCSETALDIFQDTFIRYANYKSKQSIENPRAFIFKIAANLATDHLRSCARERRHLAEQQTMPAAEPTKPSLECSAVSEQQLSLLMDALMELPPKCRTVFVLLKLKHYSYAQVEAKLGISQTMILKYLNRALSHCRSRIERDD